MTAVAVAPDGSWLVTGTHSQGIRIWDIASGKERRTLSRQDITAEAARPADSQNATGRFARMIRTRDTAATRLMARFGLRNDWVTSVAVAPDGTWLAGGGVDGMIRVWNPATGKLQATLAGHSGPVVAVAVAPDASWIAAAASSGTIRIWDTATSRQQSSFPTHGTWTTAIAVRRWRLARGGCRRWHSIGLGCQCRTVPDRAQPSRYPRKCGRRRTRPPLAGHRRTR